MRVLIVEDDPRIVAFLVKGLAAEGYASAVAADAETAQTLLATTRGEFDLVLLDLGLPGGDGTSVLRSTRSRHPDLPVIILTARHDVREKVATLDAGASDYVTKPFAFDELLARIRVALRKRDQEVSTVLVAEDLRLDLVSKVAWRGDRRIELSVREWSLLEFFLRHPRQMLSRTQILNHVWGYGYDPGSNVVDVYIGYLRRKLNGPDERALIHTVRGAGYRLLPP